MKIFEVKLVKCQEIQKEVNNFYKNFCPYSQRDIEEAIIFLKEAGINENELIKAIKDFCESTGYDLKEIDPCNMAWDIILKKTAKEIKKHISYDISDIIYTGNYFDKKYSFVRSETKEKLRRAISKLPENIKEELQNNKVVMKFLHELEITSF